MSNAATLPAQNIAPVRAGHLGIGIPALPTRVAPYFVAERHPNDPAHNGRPLTGRDSCECGQPALYDEEMCEACSWQASRAERLAEQGAIESATGDA